MYSLHLLCTIMVLGGVSSSEFGGQEIEDPMWGGQQEAHNSYGDLPQQQMEILNPQELEDYYEGPREGSVDHGQQIQQDGPDGVKGTNRISSFTKGKTKSKNKHFSMGACTANLTTPKNSYLKCSTLNSGCQATCFKGYTFPTGENRIYFVCDNGKWRVKGSTDDTIPSCKPMCHPPCQNGGSCFSPNKCKCPEYFIGPYCQYEHKRCIGFPPTPSNSERVCSNETCIITCLDRHQFPDGSAIANVFCREGEWRPSRPDWPTIPDCKPVCIPECQNGGSCLALNKCNCPQQFRGPYCQYSVDACDSRKLNFNGNYNCSERGGRYSCTLSCSSGMDFKTPPAQEYSCFFSEGMFMPPTVPECVFVEDEDKADLPFLFANGAGSMMNEVDIMSQHRSRKINVKDLSVGYSDLVNTLFVLETKTPTPGSCVSWAGFHYRTFDGKVVSFKSGCTYTLASDVVDNTFQVQTSAASCTSHACKLSISLFVGDKKYHLGVDDHGLPVVDSGTQQWIVPSQLADLTTQIVGYSVVATLPGLGVSLRWNLQDVVEVKVSEALWNRTGGLCGRMDGHLTNDLEEEEESVIAYASHWKADSTAEKCTSAVEEDSCLDSASQQAAHQFCNRLMVDKRFDACRKIMPTRQYYEACRWDHCACHDRNPDTCGCRSIAMFVHDCLQKGEKSVQNWRDQDNCQVECSGGRVYKACGPSAVPTCMTEDSELLSVECEEGCFCPKNMRLHEGHCVPREQCPCYLRGKAFPKGHKVAKGCNTCECVGGQWQCTEIQCEARCHAIGDPHYQTFDGRRYNFMGKCSYYLLQTDNYTIDAENIACDGRISETMGFSLGTIGSTPSCTKGITIRMGDNLSQVLRLKQNQEVTVNNEDIDGLPITLAGAYVRMASSMYLQVLMPDGVEVWWDGKTRIYITAPPELRGKTKGLCGTFNDNQKDDFLTPEGDVEQEPIAFANKWKTREVCTNSETQETAHPCDSRVMHKAMAQALCSNITSNLFADCHYLVDPAPYFDDCLYDVCSCNGPPEDCLCPVISSYAKECSFQGATIDWRDNVKACGVQCPSGQQYQVCGSTCSRSCQDLARPCPQNWQCVEGCYCPTGHTLNAVGDCIPVASCPCIHNGVEYPPTHKEIRPGTKSLQFCECKNGKWQCGSATPEQIKDYPNHSLELETACSATRHQEHTHCEPPEPVTCKNMHNPPAWSPSICRAGCVCRRGYVLDSLSKECVKPSQCPCHHGGQSYSDGHKILDDCNTCTCEAGKWNCTQYTCPAVCTAWGDSHFRTFDDRIFDFQGACSYMLAKGSLSETELFNVAIELVTCGSSGVSCSKSVTLSVGTGDNHETVTFKSSNPTPSAVGLQRITIRQAGLFVFAEVADLGLVLQWDRGTRVMLKADQKWKGRLKGLCGNYNGDANDDFQTPSGGLSEVSPQLFGDSWKLQPYCPEPNPVQDTCKLHPTRRAWAVKQCGILKSPVFRPCHSEVPIDPYLDRCIFDSCGCDQGGDCECLCTALAAYAQECNGHGVHIKWRTQQLCPIQCDERCSEYKPCVQTCPLQTCDNLFVYKSLSSLCKDDICVEGCDIKPCPEGQVYSNMTDLQCIPVSECKPVCLTINGTDYFEGDFIEGDDCYSCYCSRQKKSCTGVPCTTTAPPTTVVEPIKDQPMLCIPGWSEWISNDQPIPGKKDSDIEPLPLPKQFKTAVKGVKGVKKQVSKGQCAVEFMKDIECRTLNGSVHFKETLQDVECSLERGLVCLGVCDDYKIRVLCQCSVTTMTTPTTTTELTTTTTQRTTPTTTTTTTTTPTTTTEEVELITCDMLKPLTVHPSDCSKYYQCVESEHGVEQLERQCAPLLWFNSETMNCDWPDRVKDIRPECGENRDDLGVNEVIVTGKPVTVEISGGCRSDEQWQDCALPCDQLCLYYEYVLEVEGKCTSGRKCVPGCRPKNSPPTCDIGFRWRDWGSCVRIDDCTCRSPNGTIVKPGEVIHESHCRKCICLKNHYTCDDSACHTTTTEEVTTPTEPTTILTEPTSVLIITSTVSPPPLCDQDRLIPILAQLPDSTLSASSSEPGSEPENGRLSSRGKTVVLEGEGWRPAVVKEGEYLQVDLGKMEPLYGIWSAGGLQHVTSYLVLYSSDNVTFSYVSLYGEPEVFRGSAGGEPLNQMFSQPIEARYVRVLPRSWVGGISMSIELVGCGDLPTTSTTTTTTEMPTTLPTTILPECIDEMGLDSGAMDPRQVTVSSHNHVVFHPKVAALSSPTGWIPLLKSSTEWIQFDFLEEHILTGVKTKGSPEAIEGVYDPAWITTYKVTYSHDGVNWNPIVGPNRTEKVFLGNFDSNSLYTNYFDKPIHAQYLRFYPNTWHNVPALRIEILGCFLPYPKITTEEVPTTTEYLPTTEGLCNVCEGAPGVKPCPCSENTWWDGEQCTIRSQCPCYVGHISYAVGATYDTEDCDQCICSLNGQPRCSKKLCPSCSQGLQAILTTTCGCVCKPCAEGTRLCPSSNVCINSTSWCDGILDCPDDEIDCTTTTTTTTTATPPTTVSTTTIAARIVGCPKVECPEGSEVQYITKPEQQESPQWSPFGTKSKWATKFKGGVKGGVKGGRKGLPPHKTRRPVKAPYRPTPELFCPEYKCIPIKPEEDFCPVPKCADGYDLKAVAAEANRCPTYTCERIRVPDGWCNVTGRTFDTFDGLEYKYDICDHTLAQDIQNKTWQIKMKKICPYVGPCSKVLIIVQEGHTIQFNQDLTVLYDGYSYTVPQMQKIGSQTREFVINQVSNKFVTFASILDFTIVWDRQANVKIAVPGSMHGAVEGLCGYFDGNAKNDRRKPDGSQAQDTLKFGESWGKNGCETKACPIHVQNSAWEMCSAIKKEPLSQCAGAVNLDKAQSVCVESVCACLEHNASAVDACRCQALLDLVTQCQANSPTTDLHTWRVQHDCPVTCPAPLVYKECFRRVCEPSCSDLLNEDPCPVVEGECFPGCYCPDGLVREGDQCILPARCRDCSCNGFGKTRFVSFDQVDFSFSANCTYVLSKTLDSTQGPKFKVLVTHGLCGDQSGETCIKSLTLVYLDHTILVGGNNSNQSALVDSKSVSLPHELGWGSLAVTVSKEITLSVPDIQLDLIFRGVDRGFTLKLPSHLYRDNTEGLCGICNNNQTDDFTISTKETTEDADVFGKSWRATDLPSVLGTEEQCEVASKNNTCDLPPEDNDYCLKLMDLALFGRCHAVVDPEPFVDLCHESWCQSQNIGCKDLEMYVRECQAAGICLEWRSSHLCPYDCPTGLQYKACGLGCDITCDNVELFRQDPTACYNPSSETCICPDNKVWKNGTCVDESRCQPCDVEGHYPGDTWTPDVCTTCTCQVANSVQCQRIQCPSTTTVCERGYKSVVVQGTESDCCPKYMCVPEPKEEVVCPTPVQPVCGFGQVMKAETGPSGCQEFICQCLPVEECPDLSGMIVFTEEPGMHAVRNDSGCCPRIEEVCKPETCPPPPTCPPFQELVKRDVERCCLSYRCEPLKETCLYEMEYIDDTAGGERRRKPSERFMVAKKDGDSWQDGPCRVCECHSHGWRAKCSVQQCPVPPKHSDYVIEAVPLPGQCCPNYKRTACKFGNTIFKEGEVFTPGSEEPCKNITCERLESGELDFHVTTQTCNKDCPLGWEYTEPVFTSSCCGECKPVACVVNGTAHPRGSSWPSIDNCTTFTCDITGTQVQVIASQEECPNLADCPTESQYKDGCCVKCNLTIAPHSLCAPESLPSNETVRLVRIRDSSHGLCENYDAIAAFTECRGTCDSFTTYNQESGRHDSQCQCCQPVEYNSIVVDLMCEDGFPIKKTVTVPSNCGCEACAESIAPTKHIKRPYIKA